MSIVHSVTKSFTVWKASELPVLPFTRTVLAHHPAPKVRLMWIRFDKEGMFSKIGVCQHPHHGEHSYDYKYRHSDVVDHHLCFGS